MHAPLGKFVPGTDNKVFHRPRHNYLARLCEVGNSCTDMDRDSTEGITDYVAFAGMYSRTNLEAESLESAGDLERTGDGSGRF